MSGHVQPPRQITPRTSLNAIGEALAGQRLPPRGHGTGASARRTSVSARALGFKRFGDALVQAVP